MVLLFCCFVVVYGVFFFFSSLPVLSCFGFDDTPSVFLIRCRNVRRVFFGFPEIYINEGSQYFDSESAATPSLGRRVGTEASGDDNAVALSSCRPRGRFWFCAFCLSNPNARYLPGKP